MLVIKSRLARNDILETSKYIAGDNYEAGVRFFDAVDESIDLLKTTPRAGVEIAERKGLRMWFIKGFEKHLIFYRVMNNEITIERVLHSAMDYRKVITEK